MKVQVNPASEVNGQSLRVMNPETGKDFPKGPFELTDRQLRNPKILRLLPPVSAGGIAGGLFGDLVPVAAKAEKKG
ncbi:MAG: hypothetical protein JKY47_02440 [Thalassospira sp.]|jgi:hypothetical protein|nr:hypothetical protein [Thalassospira sp.]